MELPNSVRFLAIIFSVLSLTFGVPISEENTQEVWMPNLRGLPLGRNGEVVAEFEVIQQKLN